MSVQNSNTNTKVKQETSPHWIMQQILAKIFISCHQATGPTPDAANRRQNISPQNTYSSKSPAAL